MNKKQEIKITTNLMPCPFCGNEAVVVEGHEHNFIGGYSIDLKIECSYCSANLGSSYGQYGKKITTKEEVLETLKSEWNTRV